MAVKKTMLFGPIGRQVEIPWPLSGMGTDVNLNTETTTLLSGEQAVYRAPVSYKTYNMSWKGNSAKLQPIIDMYNGVYGNGPYYMTDPIAGVEGNNLLQAKWAAPHLLAHTSNGWGNPIVQAQTNTPESKQVLFTKDIDDQDEYPYPAVVPVIPGAPVYAHIWGSRTGTASVRVYRFSRATGAWSLSNTMVPTLGSGAPVTVVSASTSAAGDIVAVKLVPYLPANSTLTLQHIDLATNDYRIYTPALYNLPASLYPKDGLYPGMLLFPSSSSTANTTTGTMFRSGKGAGPVQFTGNIGGNLDSFTIDRIGLSIDLSEVSRDPNH